MLIDWWPRWVCWFSWHGCLAPRTCSPARWVEGACPFFWMGALFLRGDRARLRVDAPALFEQGVCGPQDFLELIGQISAGEVVPGVLFAHSLPANFGESGGYPL